MIYFIGFLLRRIANDFHLCLNALGGVTHVIGICGSEVRLPEQSFSHFCVTCRKIKRTLSISSGVMVLNSHPLASLWSAVLYWS